MENAPAAVDKEDRVALFITVGVAALIAVAALVTGVSRLVEIAPGTDVPVRVSLEGETTVLDLEHHAATPVVLETGIVTVSDPSATTMAASVAEPIITTLAVVAGALIAAIVLTRLARGTALARRTYLPIHALAVITLVAGLASSFFQGVASSSALADLGGDDALNVTFSLLPVFASLAIAAVGVAFEAAHRLSKDTEGLV